SRLGGQHADGHERAAGLLDERDRRGGRRIPWRAGYSDIDTRASLVRLESAQLRNRGSGRGDTAGDYRLGPAAPVLERFAQAYSACCFSAHEDFPPDKVLSRRFS